MNENTEKDNVDWSTDLKVERTERDGIKKLIVKGKGRLKGKKDTYC